nr:hypothetical protein [Microbacterium hydrocarbonoxydans]
MTEDPKRLRWAVNGARTFTVPTDAVGAVLGELDRTMQAAHFRRDPSASGAERVYRRGSTVGDVLIGGSGLSVITSRIGPLSAKGVAIVSVDHSDAAARVIVSLVAGSHVGADFVDAVEDAVGAFTARGVPLDDQGWTRAVDVDPALPANPRRATELGLT